jgi:hypothetical protein
MNTRLHTFERTAPPPSFTPLSSGVLQRKCACGGSAALTGKCDNCSSTQNLSPQRASASSEPETQNSGHVTPGVHQVLASTGQPLDRRTRAFMEPRFGHDFSEVRIHTDSQAARSANEVDALAYTVGRHIVFRENQYRPGTAVGDRLLAHELTHTIQQSTAGAGFQGSLAISSPQDAAELEADAVATRIVRGQGATIGRQSSWQIARQQPEATSAAAASAPPVVATEDAGQKRARIAKELVDKLKAANATYKHENPRDWENSAVSDCSKFVQWVLEGAGEGELFGRESARTATMRDVIAGLTPADQPSFRLTDPKVGDIMMWGGHVGIVYELVDQKGTSYLVFAHMGTSGARLLGKSDNGFYWLKASDTAKIDEMGDGAFMGFWTPP